MPTYLHPEPRTVIWIYRICKNDQWFTLLSRLYLDEIRTSYAPFDILVIGDIVPRRREITIY